MMSPMMMMNGLSPETMAGLGPQQVQGMMQMAALQGMMGPAAAANGGGGGMSPEVVQSMMQMASMQGLPPAAVQSMMASMVGGRGAEGGGDSGSDNPWEQFIKQSLSASRAVPGFFTGMRE